MWRKRSGVGKLWGWRKVGESGNREVVACDVDVVVVTDISCAV